MSKPSHQELKSISHKQFKADILAELRKQTTLLEVLAKQGELTLAFGEVIHSHERTTIAPATGGAASGLSG
jgi:hypothetical protein